MTIFAQNVWNTVSKKKKKMIGLDIFDQIIPAVMNSSMSLCPVLVLSLPVLGPVAPFAGVQAHRPAAVKKQVGGATETKRAGAGRKEWGPLLWLKDNYESASTSQCCVVSGSGRAAPSQQASGGPRGQRPPVSGVGGSDNGPRHRPSVMCLHTSDGGSERRRAWSGKAAAASFTVITVKIRGTAFKKNKTTVTTIRKTL